MEGYCAGRGPDRHPFAKGSGTGRRGDAGWSLLGGGLRSVGRDRRTASPRKELCGGRACACPWWYSVTAANCHKRSTVDQFALGCAFIPNAASTGSLEASVAAILLQHSIRFIGIYRCRRFLFYAAAVKFGLPCEVLTFLRFVIKPAIASGHGLCASGADVELRCS